MKLGRLVIVFFITLSLVIWMAVEFSESSVSSHQKSIPSSSPPGIAEVVFEAMDGEITKLHVPLKFEALRKWSDTRVNFLSHGLSAAATLYVCLETFWSEFEGKYRCDEGRPGPERSGELSIRIYADKLVDRITFGKEFRILPSSAPRDFEVIYGLMSLGFAKDYRGQTVGRVFRKGPDDTFEATWSQDFYYIPEEEDQWEGFYIWCTNPEKTLAPKGVCTAHKQLTRHVYVEYVFDADLLESWRELDKIVNQAVLVQPSS